MRCPLPPAAPDLRQSGTFPALHAPTSTRGAFPSSAGPPFLAHTPCKAGTVLAKRRRNTMDLLAGYGSESSSGAEEAAAKADTPTKETAKPSPPPKAPPVSLPAPFADGDSDDDAPAVSVKPAGAPAVAAAAAAPASAPVGGKKRRASGGLLVPAHVRSKRANVSTEDVECVARGRQSAAAACHACAAALQGVDVQVWVRAAAFTPPAGAAPWRRPSGRCPWAPCAPPP